MFTSVALAFHLALVNALGYAPAPVDNPLKGLVPYSGENEGRFPHSMEFNYFPLSALVKGDGVYDWTPLEALLNDCASRGHQTIFRVYVEYPGQVGGIPAYLIDRGLKVFKYDTDPKSSSKEKNETPDYTNPLLRDCIVRFILAMGKRYDGDPRIGFITAGLLGKWGEWHDYPQESLFADKSLQANVLDAYEKGFTKTAVLLRYPYNDSDKNFASNIERRFGYHDDSFAWATLDTGKPGDEWFFLSAINRAGKAARDKWKTMPIGGEIRPEAWGEVFDSKVKNPQIQDFDQCVAQTHATWLMDSGMFNKSQSKERVSRALSSVQRMGYELSIASVEYRRSKEGLEIVLGIENRGVAPFYADWPVQVAVQLADGSVKDLKSASIQLNTVLPGVPATRVISISAWPSKGAKLLIGIKNPMQGGHPMRFANKDQDRDVKGWLSLPKGPWQ